MGRLQNKVKNLDYDKKKRLSKNLEKNIKKKCYIVGKKVYI